MNLLLLLDRLSTVDVPSEAAPRRDLLRQLGHAGVRAAAAALPLALATPALAAPTNNTLDAALLLLRLEDLLVAFYTRGLATVLANQAAVRPDFERLLRQQESHARFLRAAIAATGLTPPPAATFDFSGRRNNPANPVLFPNVLTDYGAFLQLAQQLEDASASVYLGQIEFMVPDKQLFDAIQRMQTVEARHASHLRTLRRNAGGAAVKSWPSTADAAPAAPVLVPGANRTPVSIYSLEANEVQRLGTTPAIPFPTVLTGKNAVQFRAIAEAFDEPLSTLQATALLAIFS